MSDRGMCLAVSGALFGLGGLAILSGAVALGFVYGALSVGAWIVAHFV